MNEPTKPGWWCPTCVEEVPGTMVTEQVDRVCDAAAALKAHERKAGG